jgi:flagellar biosynthetic protein FliO
MPILLGAMLVGLILITVGRNDEHKGVFAQTAATATPAISSDSSHTTPVVYEPMTGKSAAAMSLIKMLAALAVVVVCIYVGIFLLKKLMNKRYTGSRGSSLLEIIETAYIDPKKSLSLVRVADKSVLIGVTENQISVLTELDPTLTQAVVEQSSKQQPNENFMTLLKSASGKLRGTGKSKGQPDS